MSLLSVEGVSKRYGPVVAVNGVSFAAGQGRIFGLLGPNGAGKTSTIRMITYITAPDEGRITFEGKEVGPWSQDRMGYLPEERGLYKKMKVGEQLVYLAMLKGMREADARASIRRWLERFEASDWAGKKIEELSKGMQQKVQFVATIAHDPALLIFDEPFSGLDPINSELLKSVILELKEDGRTILFASHRMEQVEQMCDDICLIAQGRVVLSGGLREVKRRFGRDTVKLEFEGDGRFVEPLEAAGQLRVVTRGTNHVELRLLNGTSPRLVLEAALAGAREVHRYELVEPSLNEIFIQTVGAARREDLRQPEPAAS